MSKCIHYLEHPGINQGYFAPTYGHIRDIFFPTIEEVAYSFGMNVEIREGNKEVHFYTGKQYRGTSLCRTMDKPGSIVGFKIGHGLIDELDVMKADKAETAWRKIMARMRYNEPGVKNGLDVATTPEGFRFTHKMFVKMLIDKPELRNNYGLIQASTHDNAKNLPDDYIPSLLEAYPAELIDAYINGQFCNLSTGTVYRSYNRTKHRSHETIQDKEELFIGMDFNVGHMAATIYVKRKTGWHAVAELIDVFDTPDIIRIIQERWQGEGHKIYVYPDASGKNRKSVGASTSDIGLLEQAKFAVRAHNSNPLVKNRLMSVNKQFEDGNLWINDNLCPVTADCLEQQPYDKNGEPDKDGGFDHQNDATGYPIAYEFPIVKPVINVPIKFSM